MAVSNLSTLNYYGVISVADGIGYDESDFTSVILYGVLCAVSIIVNISILLEPKKKPNAMKTNLDNTNLALANLLLTCKVQVELMYSQPREWPYGLCQLTAAGRVFGFYLSGYLTIVINMRRYKNVVNPLRFLRATETATATSETRKLLIIAYLAAIVSCVRHAIISHVGYTLSGEKFCVIYPVRSFSNKLTSMMIRITLTYLFPCGTILWYHIKLRKHFVGAVVPTKDSEVAITLNEKMCRRGRTITTSQKQTILQLSIFVISYTGYYSLGPWKVLFEKSFENSPIKLRRVLYFTYLLKPCLDGLLIKYFNAGQKNSSNIRDIKLMKVTKDNPTHYVKILLHKQIQNWY